MVNILVLLIHFRTDIYHINLMNSENIYYQVIALLIHILHGKEWGILYVKFQRRK